MERNVLTGGVYVCKIYMIVSLNLVHYGPVQAW